MAKLNGITVLGEVIDHDGRQYAASTGSAEVGDIIKALTRMTDVSIGDYFIVKSGTRRPLFTDNAGDDRPHLCIDSYVRQGGIALYKPVQTPVTPVKRAAKIGETIKIVAASGTRGMYNNGDTFIVSDTIGGGILVNSVKTAGNRRGFIHNDEYVVLEPLVSPPTPRPYQPGDVVKSKATGSTYTLAKRDPSLDRHGFGNAWTTTNGGWSGEQQIELVTPAAEKPAAPTPVEKPADAYHIIGSTVYAKKARPAKVGETVLVVQDFSGGKIGDVTTISYSGFDGTRTADRSAMNHERYVVLTPIDAAVVHGGNAYRAVKRKAAAGDLIIVTGDNNGNGKRNGTVLTADERYDMSSAAGTNLAVGVSCDDTQIRDTDYSVLEPLTSMPATPPIKTLSVGDFVKVVGGDNSYTKIGDIVKIAEIDWDGDFRIDDLNGKRIGGFKRARNVVAATPAEIAAATQSLAPAIKIGDTVKLTIAEGKQPRYSYGRYGIKNGDIGVVARFDSDGDLRVNFPNHSDWIGLISEFTLLTPAEVAAMAETAKWSAIGRRVNEYHVGDTVKLVGEVGYNGLRKAVGIITTIDSVDNYSSGYKYHLVKPSFINCDGDTWTKGSVLEMVKPA